jgi:hypothetical protein
MYSHLSSGKSSIEATCWIPALFTRTSTAPNSRKRSVNECATVVVRRHVGPLEDASRLGGERRSFALVKVGDDHARTL